MSKPLADRILALLDDPRADVRCAAALVLGQAGKGDGQLTKRLARRLAKHLHDPSSAVRGFVLDALEGARGLEGDLAGLLADPDDDIRERAVRLLAASGAAAVKVVARTLQAGTPAARRSAAALLIRSASPPALDAVLDRLADPEAGETILQLLRAEIDKGDAKLRRLLGARASAAARKAWPRAARGKDPAALAAYAALLRLIGYLADPAALPLLVKATGKAHPTPVRLGAIAALRRVVASSEGKIDAAVSALIALASDPDLAIARAAVDTLRGARIPEKLARSFAGLARSKNPDARKLALERMPSVSQGGRGVADLLANLTGADPQARDAAFRALASSPEAAGPLARALAAATDPEPARRLAQALRAHETRTPAAAVQALLERAKRAEGPVTAVVLDALARLDPAGYAATLYARAARLRHAGDYAGAFAALRPLTHTTIELSGDQRFFLAVLGLKASGRDLLRAARSVDPVLGAFAALLASGYPLARKLLADKDVEPDDLFVLGFNFCESDDDNEKEFGRELLAALVERHPRGKLATAARNKLRLEDHA